jgi:hypothetical protein
LKVPCDPAAEAVQHYHLEERYPNARTSRWLSLGALLLPWTNPGFMAVSATLYVLLGWASQFANRSLAGRESESLDGSIQRLGWFDHLSGLFRSPVSVLLLLVVLAGLIGFAAPSANWSQGRRRVTAKAVMGVSHLVVQLAVGALVGVAAVKAASFTDGWLFTVVLLAALTVLGALAGTVVMGMYLAICCALLRSHGNEAFSSMTLTRYKNFLRMHIDGNGRLTVYPIGLDAANKAWRFDADNPDSGSPWLVPKGGELGCRLIEPPVVIDPLRTAEREQSVYPTARSRKEART